MRLFSYVLARDYGLAPHPYHGWCTLAVCMPRIRRAADPGDWVIGCGGAAAGLAGRLVYAMRVAEALSLDAYWHDPRFGDRRPDPQGPRERRCGDNLYHRSETGAWVQAPSYHSRRDGQPDPAHLARDTAVDRVLVAARFSYFGRDARPFPPELAARHGVDPCRRHRGHRSHFPDALVAAVAAWLEELPQGVHGEPARRGVRRPRPTV